MKLIPTQQPTSSMHYVRILIEQLEKSGQSSDDILARLGIDITNIERNPSRIETHKLANFVKVVWEKLQDENLGYARYPCKLGTFYWMGRVSVHEPTLRKALNVGVRYCNYSVDDYRLELRVAGNIAYFIVHMKYPELDPYHALTELILMGWHRYSSWLIGVDIPIIESFFTYKKPKHWEEYKYIMPSIHRFESGEIGFCFAASYLDLDVVQKAEKLGGFMERCPADLFLRHRGNDSYTTKVRLILEKYICKEPLPTINLVSDTLNVAPETLRRKLREEGVSYMKIKDMVRMDTAIYHLHNRQVSIGDISELVGFSSPSVFSRAFKDWIGVAPNEFRCHQQELSS